MVVPVFNERASLGELDAEIRAIAPDLETSYEIIYVDDRSTDGSYEILEQCALQHRGTKPETRLVRLRRNYGQTAAMAAGFDAARGDVVVALDGDGQNDPADIPHLVEKIRQGYDVVSGWRRERQDGKLRVWLSRIANRILTLVSGVRLHDSGCTLKAYRRSLLEEVHLYGEMHRFIPVYLARQGAKVTEEEVSHRPRSAGESKYGSERIVKVLFDLVLLLFVSRYFARPMHFFGQVAALFGLLLVSVFALMVIFKFGWLGLLGIPYQADFIETPLPALAGTFIVGAVTAVLLGVVAELLVRIYYEFEGRRPFAVEKLADSATKASLAAESDQHS